MKHLLLLSSIFFSPINAKRSIHRPIDPLMPTITTYWPKSTIKHSLQDWHLEEIPVFYSFDKKNFKQHQLPIGPIPYRNHPQKSVTGKKLGQLADHVIKEIQEGKHTFTHFTKLKVRDFCDKDRSGLAILKYKDCPFVLKLFIENPASFVRPYSKGFEPTMFFWMSGTMRHLTGFGRIKNLERIKTKLKTHPVWSKRVDLPRKWFWEPKDNRYFVVEGKNIGQVATQKIKLPSIYAIICDAIQAPKKLKVIKKKHRDECLKIAKFLEYNLDPHLPNFLPEKETGKLVIIDTEHFPGLTGLKRKLDARSYMGWYIKLSYKAFTDKYCRSKRARHDMQRKLRSSYYPY